MPQNGQAWQDGLHAAGRAANTVQALGHGGVVGRGLATHVIRILVIDVKRAQIQCRHRCAQASVHKNVLGELAHLTCAKSAVEFGGVDVVAAAAHDENEDTLS